ncbi:signal transduction histidine kinase [Streptacidiphilus sp. MAP12-20]|uniref:sensor histidine kinase n=1 Tax=Streptacidiphilus sp. MAP12-20 TaxID=3156299 RepID=UPI003514E3A2
MLFTHQLADWQRYLRDHLRAVDTAVAVLIFGVSALGVLIPVPGVDHPASWWWGMLLAGVASASVLWHRNHPRAVVAVTSGCMMGAAGLGLLLSPLLLAPLMLALYSLAARTDGRTTLAFSLGSVALVVLAAVFTGPAAEPGVLKIVGPEAWLLLPAALGRGTRLRVAYVGAVEARAEHAERTREEEARHRVAEERIRIARELHDVVAHHLALANAQAGTAAHLMRTNPDQAEKIVTELAGTTSAALRELKATVGLMRQANDPDAPLDPAPGLAQLVDLAASFGTAGLTVTIATDGKPQPLSPGVDLTAYRIVQEALTNVTKHATTRAALVRLTYSRDRLSITVTNDDDGTDTPPATRTRDGGYGLLGMRERATSIGGRLRAGRRPEGGFEVATELPLHPHAPEEDQLP